MTYKAQVSSATLCTATITRKKNRIKSYGDPSSVEPLKYFLKDGEEFEVELFNPLQVQVLAKIKINGLSISSSGIVLMPGQRVFLERYIDTNEKFVYKTYEVEDSKEAKGAIVKNGDISVEFYHERVKPNYHPLMWPTYTSINNYNNTITSPFNAPYGSTLTNTIGGNLGSFYTGGTTDNTFSTSSIGSTSNCFYSTSNLSSGGTLDLNIPSMDSLNDQLSDSLTKSVETGRIAGGTASSQLFETVYGDFNTFASQTVSMKTLPESQKPVEVSEIRSYCPGCRTRIKKTSWKFCPSCGEDLS